MVVLLSKAKSNIQSQRKNNLANKLKKIKKAGEELEGVILDKNPTIAKIELQALGIAERIKKEGLQGNA